MLAHCVGGNAFLWNAIFVGVVATASVCAPPATRPGGSSPLDEVINGMIPLFRLDNLNGAVLSGQPSSYSCFTATRSPISVHWEVNGSQAFDRKQFEIFYSPIDTIGPESMLVFARYSTLTIRQTVGTTVRCIVQQYDEEHSNHSLRVTRRVTLSTISTVAKANDAYVRGTSAAQLALHPGISLRPTGGQVRRPLPLPQTFPTGRLWLPHEHDAEQWLRPVPLMPRGGALREQRVRLQAGLRSLGLRLLAEVPVGRRHAQGTRCHPVHADCRVHRCHGVSRRLALPPLPQSLAHARALCGKLGVHAQDGSDIMRACPAVRNCGHC
ncbi:uncharacterized protein LOC119171432 isoform X2 [Rhipicephalus microplus]|uniref:uncharacterized protein LOC119171432 isoform X2 n=1 Tax=Rhipicephalus microplus TaxID=6941 RepID=UPI003F6D9C36